MGQLLIMSDVVGPRPEEAKGQASYVKHHTCLNVLNVL